MSISQFDQEVFNKMYKNKAIFKKDNNNIEQVISEFKDNNDFYIQHECKEIKPNKVIVIYDKDIFIVEGNSTIKKPKNNIILPNDLNIY